MAALSRKKKSPEATASSEARAEGRGRRLKPTFVYEETFDTHALGKRLLGLTELTQWKGLALIAFDWAVTAAAIAGTYALGSALPWAFWPAWVVAVLVVGGRMHALLIVMHDASHQRLLHDRVWNDRLANWLCAYPALVSVESYRKEHLQHHFFANSDRDPNWVTKKDDPEWAFPQRKAALALLFAKELVGFGFLRMIRYQLNYRKHEKSIAAKRSKGRAKLAERLGYYALLAAGLTASGGWAPFARRSPATTSPGPTRSSSRSPSTGTARGRPTRSSRPRACRSSGTSPSPRRARPSPRRRPPRSSPRMRLRVRLREAV